MLKKVSVLLLIACITVSCLFHTTASAEVTSYKPETLSLTPGKTQSDLNFTWYSSNKEGSTSIVKITDTITGFSKEFTGTCKKASEGKLYHKVTVSGLNPDTKYSYQVSNDKVNYSGNYNYTTAGIDSFRFAYVGDPQLTEGEQDKTSNLFSSNKTTLQGWKDTVNKIAAAKVNFIAGVGDQVDKTAKGSEAEYINFFAPLSLSGIPFAPAVGNHDRHYLFQYHFNLPNEQKFIPIVNDSNKNDIETATVEAAGNYWYMYNNVLFVVLNTSAYPANTEEAKPYIERFEKTLAAATKANKGKYDWIFVQHHKSTASVAQHVADVDIQYYVEAGFEKLMDKYNVDFVLAGHDHVYARSYVMKNGAVTNKDEQAFINPDGTVYLTATTASGLKYYNIFDNEGLYVKDNKSYPHLVNGLFGSIDYLKKNYPLSTNIALQNKKPEYTIIDVKNNIITFNTYDIDSSKPIDTFTVIKLAK